MVSVREMTNEEFGGYAEFSFENFVKEMAASSGESIDKVRKDMGGPPVKRSARDLWLVIEHTGSPVGFIWIQLSPEKHEAFGYDIYLEPEYRDQKIGRSAMLLMKSILQSRGIQVVRICVFEENLRARHLYESLGFSEIKFDPDRKQHHLQMQLR